MEELDPCPRRGKFFGGCRFEARYSFPAFTLNNVRWHPLTDSAAGVIEAQRPRTYEGDICIRCGKRVERPSSVSGERG